MSLGCPSKGSNFERKIIIISIKKQATVGLITILYMKNSNEECFIGFKVLARDILLVSYRLLARLLPKKILKGPSELNAENLGAQHMK